MNLGKHLQYSIKSSLYISFRFPVQMQNMKFGFADHALLNDYV